MKKVTLLCLASDRNRTLDALRSIGVVHLEHVREPAGPDIDDATAQAGKTEELIRTLKLNQPKGVKPQPDASLDADAVMARAQERIEEQRRLTADLDRLIQERDAQAVFGDFDPGLLNYLKDKGRVVRLFSTHVRNPDFSAEAQFCLPLARIASGTFFALVGDGEPSLAATEIPVPERRLSAVVEEIERARQKLDAVNEALGGLSMHIPTLERSLEELWSRIRYLEAEKGMGQSGAIEYLAGFCPVNQTGLLESAAAENGWALIIEAPAPGDRVPTLIKSPAWVRPIRSLFKLLDIVPGYKEAETRSAFMIFFSIFFGILVNDAGYGLVFLLLTIGLRLKLRKAPAEPFKLFGLLSVCAIIWGILTGSYFGILHLPSPLKTVEISWFKNEQNFMSFAFLLGAIHLTVAHAWRAMRLINSSRALAQVGWICVVWCAYFLARMLILGMTLPGWFLWLLVAGGSLVILFMTPMRKLKTEWADHIMLPFDFIGSFADLVSYVRLFAVASASMAVAEAFNELATHKGIHSWQAGLIAVIILTLGHGLNIILALMSILVHGVRLNTLEFSSHVGMEWTGRPYEPFSKSSNGDIE